MNDKEPSHKTVCILLVIFIILVSFAAIIPSHSNGEIQMDKSCLDLESDSMPKLESHEENVRNQLDCSLDYKKELFKLFVLGLVNIDELAMWVLGVDRRLIVLKMMHEKRLLQASDIAETTDRSLQNISYAMRELEERGLIRCLTPEKHTWKKFIPTEKGTEIFEKLKKNHFID